MSNTEVQGLIVSLEARTTQLERGLKRAQEAQKKASEAMERRAKKSANEIVTSYDGVGARISAGLKSVALPKIGAGVVGAVAGMSLGAIIGETKQLASSIAEIGSNATMAGVSFKAFQEWSYVAEQTRIPIDAITDGLKEMSLRADEFAATGAGSAAEAFQRIGLSPEEAKIRLQDPSALLVEIIERTRSLGDTAAGIRIFDELFGGQGGERMVALLKNGSVNVKSLIAEANKLGMVLDDDIINRATEIDAQFNKISRTIELNMKGAIVKATFALEDFFDRFNDKSEQNARNQELYIKTIRASKERITRELKQAEEASAAMPQNAFLTGDVERLNAALADLERQEADAQTALDKLTGSAKGASGTLPNLTGGVTSAGAAAAKSAKNFKDFAEGLRELSKEVPELAAKMEDLDARTKIEETYRATVAKAGSHQEIAEAKRLKDQAIKALDDKPVREAASGGILDLIAQVEGTRGKRNYNETLDYGRWTGGPVNLTGMTLDEIDALQSQMLADPKNRATYGGKGSSAVGRYQITRSTLRDLRGDLGLEGSEYYTPELQDRLAQELLRRRGPNPDALRNEWEGLRRVDDSTIMGALDGTNLPPVDRNTEAQAASAQRASEATNALIASLEAEMNALQMTAEQRRAAEILRHAGANATDEEREKIIRLNETLYQEEAARERANAAADYQKQVLSGFISDLRNGTSAADAFANVLNKLADRIQDELLDALFSLNDASGSGSGSGNIFSNLMQAFGGAGEATPNTGAGSAGGSGEGFAAAANVAMTVLRAFIGFDSGGWTGPGTKYQPAGIVHADEFVFSKEAVRRLGVGNLDALHTRAKRGAVSGFAEGGLVGGRQVEKAATTVIERSESTTSRLSGASFSINSPVTVNATGGTPEQNADLAQRVSEQHERMLREVIRHELINQMRPGGMFKST